MNKRVVAYLRISSDREGRELGVTRQQEDCQRLADSLGYEDVEFIIENDTGASTHSKKKRPKFDDLMRRAKGGEVDVILAYSNSRLTRRMREFLDLIDLTKQHGVLIKTVVSGSFDLSTADGRATALTLATWDAAEAERTAERVQRAAKQRAESGEYHGGPHPPFGYDRVQNPTTGKMTLVINPERAELMREACRRMLAGDTLNAICHDWNAKGIATTRGSHWRGITLRTALLSPSVIGKTSAGVQGWEPILDEDDWKRLGTLLRDPARKFRSGNGSTGKRTLSGGMLVCALCGKPLVSQKLGDTPRMVCHSQATGGCGKVTIQHDPAEQFLTDLVFTALDTPAMRQALGRQQESTEERDLHRRLSELDAERKRAYDAFVKGWVPEAEFVDQRERIDTEVETVNKRLTTLATSGVVGSLDEIRRTWGERSPLARRTVLQSIVRHVVVQPHPKGVATTLTRFKDECDTCFKRRKDRHRESLLAQRLEVVWRA